MLLMDRAGGHTTSKLEMPANIKPIFPPSRSPEPNPVEKIWQHMRANWLSNRVFDHYDAILEAACNASKKLTQAPDTKRSIGMRDWAHVDWSE